MRENDNKKKIWRERKHKKKREKDKEREREKQIKKILEGSKTKRKNNFKEFLNLFFFLLLL